MSWLQAVGLAHPEPKPVFPKATVVVGDLTQYYFAPPLPHERFITAADKDFLGQGSFGTVRLVTLKSDTNRPPIEYACKTIPKTKSKDGTDYVNRAILEQEVYNLCRVSGSENIVHLMDVLEDRRNVHLIMEVCRGGELYSKVFEAKRKRRKAFETYGDSIEKSGGLDEAIAVKIIHQILTAICHCHDRHVAHRDLKASNFLFKTKEPAGCLGGSYSLSLRWMVRIIDFGLSKYVPPKSLCDKNESDQLVDPNPNGEKGDHVMLETEKTTPDDSHDDLRKNGTGWMTSEVGTPYYTAPEVLTQEKYSLKCDCWSIGAIAYLVLSGDLPVLGKDERETVKKLMDPQLEVEFDTSPRGVWRDDGPISPQARAFCQALLQRDPNLRPTSREALYLDWMTTHFGEPPCPSEIVPVKNEDIKLPCLSKACPDPSAPVC